MIIMNSISCSSRKGVEALAQPNVDIERRRYVGNRNLILHEITNYYERPLIVMLSDIA